MSSVSAVLDRIRSAARRPSALSRVPGDTAGLAALLADAAVDGNHWHAGDVRIALPAQRRAVDLRALDLATLERATLERATLERTAPVTGDAGPPPPAQPAPVARTSQAWQARPGPTTWFG